VLALLCGLGVLSGCQYIQPEAGPLPRYAFDLNGNGMNDTNLELRPCSGSPTATCLLVTSTVTADKEVLISPGTNGCAGRIQGRRLEVIGDHVNDPLQEVAILYCENSGAGSPPALAIVDVSGGRVVARAVAPPDQLHSFTDYPRDPEGRRYPFLAPSHGDGDTSQGRPLWGYLCLYKPDRAPDSKCGAGFVAVSTAPRDGFFREVGGYLQDLDADGWEDITLIYHALVASISTRTAAGIGTTEYDVAAATEPRSPKGFHDGRNYGTHSAVMGADGKLRTVIVSGMPVGGFENVMCGVSWFVAVLESLPGQPGTRALSWSRYYGFNSTIFSEINPVYADDPSSKIARPADHQNGCIHAFSDSRSVMDRENVVIFNVFRQAAPLRDCLKEQYQLYLEPRWTTEKQHNWHACIAGNLKSPGTWNTQVLRERDGTPLAANPNAYVWGASKDLLPSGEVAYLVEPLPEQPASFDLSAHPPGPMLVRALSKGMWSERGGLPVAGRPKIRAVPGSGSRGHGSYTYFAELALEDIDGDGLKDIQMADGAWVGYSSALNGFVKKHGQDLWN
jgi:hypothetical protein